MSKLFEPGTVGRLTLRNHIMRSATAERVAHPESGKPLAKQQDMYAALAQGGVGLIVTGHAYVERTGKAHPEMASIASDDVIPAWREVIRPAQEEGARIAAACVGYGVDCIEISHALGEPKDIDKRQEAPYRPWAEAVRQAVGNDFPLALVNGFRTHADMEAVLDGDLVQMVSLWVLAVGELYHLDEGQWSRFSWPDDWIEAMAVGPDGTIWVGHDNLGHFDPSSGAWQTFTPDDGLVDHYVRAIHVTPDGVVWVGTVGGVSRYAPGDITNE